MDCGCRYVRMTAPWDEINRMRGGCWQDVGMRSRLVEGRVKRCRVKVGGENGFSYPCPGDLCKIVMHPWNEHVWGGGWMQHHDCKGNQCTRTALVRVGVIGIAKTVHPTRMGRKKGGIGL
jgi:hypothetical protein